MRFKGKELAQMIHLSRRNFVKLVIGGAAGMGLTPLPWKMADDSAIWTQTWPWVPVPPEGEFSHEKSLCKLCPGGCGIEVRKVDDRPVKIEGRTDYPVNPGGICPLGAGGLQLLYNENIRFTAPMKRIGPRGSGQYAEISWNEALSELAGRIKKLRQEGKPDAIAAVDSGQAESTIAQMIQRLMKAIGSPNYLKTPGVEDTYSLANELMQGNRGNMAYDLENSDFVLSFGCGLIEGWGAPGRMFNTWGLWHSEPLKGKVKIVQVESRASNTASKADMWVTPIPGTEAALALGLAHVIIKEGLYSTKFISRHTFGFEDWTDSEEKIHKGFKSLVLEKYSPDAVAKITGLNAKDIVFLAKDFSRAKAPIAVSGQGKGELNGNLTECMAVQCLNALVGNINKKGGVLVNQGLPFSPWPEFEPDTRAQTGLARKRLDQAGSEEYPFSASLINNFTDAVYKSSDTLIDTLLVFSGNPAYTLPDGGKFRNAMEKIPFIVSFSPFRDESGIMADLILPDHTYLEKQDDVAGPTGLQYRLYGMTQPVLEPLYNTRNTGDVIIQLAGKLGEGVKTAFPWKNYDAAIKARAKGLFESGSGLTGYDSTTPPWKMMESSKEIGPDYKSFADMWKKIKSGGLWYSPRHNFQNWDSIFKTPTGKFEFCSSKIEIALKGSDLGISAKGDEALMPHYDEHSSKDEGHGHGNYPLMMMPYAPVNLSTGQMPNPPYLNKTLLDTMLRKDLSFIEINPETASEYKLKQGDRVRVKSSNGEGEAAVNIFEGARPGVVYIPMGFGHTAYDDFQKGKGLNSNHLIKAGKAPISGEPVWWDTKVELVKL